MYPRKSTLDNSTAKFCKPYPVPFSLKKPLERELSQLECPGILQKVMHNEWAVQLLWFPKEMGAYECVVNMK